MANINKKDRIAKLHKEVDSKVLVKITSSRGHDELSLSPVDALTRVQTEVNDRKKWLYLDAMHKDPNTLTTDDIMEADDILLTNALAGG
jgi:hypothetical protein